MGSRWFVAALAATTIVVGVLPAAAGAGDPTGRPALLTVAAPSATLVESPAGGFDLTIDQLYPLATYSNVARPVRSGARLPFDFGTALLDRDGVQALLRRPDAPDSEDALLVELTDTGLTPEGRFTAHASVVTDAQDALLGRAAKGLDRRLGDAPGLFLLTVADSKGEMGDVVPRARGIQVVDTDYDVVSNNIFNYTPLPRKLTYTPGSGTCVKNFVTRQTQEDPDDPGGPTFTDSWISLRGFTVDSTFECWFQTSKASYTVNLDNQTLSLEVEQESVTNSNFKVNSCSGAGFICKGSNGFKQWTINIFKA
jgi:hypothetical protein